jgi:hypothetical protein
MGTYRTEFPDLAPYLSRYLYILIIQGAEEGKGVKRKLEEPEVF